MKKHWNTNEKSENNENKNNKPPKINLQHLFFIGTITQCCDNHGTLRIQLQTYHFDQFHQVKNLYIAGSLSKYAWEYPIKKHIKRTKQHWFVRLKTIDNRLLGENLIGFYAYLPLTLLPPIQDPKHFYYFELLNCRVEDERYGNIGVVINIFDMPAQDVIEVLHPEGFRFLIPMTDETIRYLDREKKVLHTKIPDGLIEVYRK